MYLRVACRTEFRRARLTNTAITRAGANRWKKTAITNVRKSVTEIKILTTTMITNTVRFMFMNY